MAYKNRGVGIDERRKCGKVKTGGSNNEWKKNTSWMYLSTSKNMSLDLVAVPGKATFSATIYL